MQHTPLWPESNQTSIDPEAELSLGGTINRIVFHNDQTGWTVLSVEIAEDSDATAVGVMLAPTGGESVRLTGSWETHQRYGRQFRFTSYELLRPTTAEGIKRYLSGPLVEGIGPKLAAALVEKFGDRTLTILDEAPERLQEVSGIGPQRAEALTSSWQHHRQMHGVMIFLRQHGIGAALATRIYNRYGPQAVELIEQQPYRLAREIRGIGFATADKIARSVGIPRDDPQRRQAALLHVLAGATDNGHFFLPRRELLERAAHLLGLDEQLVELSLGELEAQQEVQIESSDEQQVAVYLPEMLAAERDVARRLSVIANNFAEAAPDRGQIEHWLQRRTSLGELPLTEEQQDAVRKALRSGLSVITGGPGTGKTTIIRAFTEACASLGRQIALACPTGRAAKRLEQMTGREASTIHRLLSYDPYRHCFRHGPGNPLPVDTLVVDEASMLDVLLARDLLQALAPGTQLVLVGDADQLPSVGPGNLLRDLVESGVVSVCHLTTIHRQQAGSLLVQNAHRINRGEGPYLPTGKEWRGEDCVFVEEEDPEEAGQRVVKMVAEKLPKLDFSPDNIQVITPLHRGPIGVRALNTALQQRLNPPQPTKAQIQRGETVFRTGDRVLQTVNNYDKSVYNGDIGRIVAIDTKTEVVRIGFDQAEVIYDFSELDELELAYALTIHKSQGSEYPAVVIVIHSSHYIMLQRNLLYTALTRAEQMACLVGNRRGIYKAINTASERRRYTHLQQRLREQLPCRED